MRKERQRTVNNWSGIDKGCKVLEDVVRRLKKKKKGERKRWRNRGCGSFTQKPETTPPPPFAFPSSPPPSLTSISPPLNFPLLVTTATGEGQKKTKGDGEREGEGEVCRLEAKSTKEKNSMFLLRSRADLLHQLEHGLGASKMLDACLLYANAWRGVCWNNKLCQQGKLNPATV